MRHTVVDESKHVQMHISLSTGAIIRTKHISKHGAIIRTKHISICSST